MDKFVVRTKRLPVSSVESPPIISIESQNVVASTESRIVLPLDVGTSSSRGKRARIENVSESGFNIFSDPALRIPINDYEHQIRDDVRREYVVEGPCQPRSHDFPRSSIANKSRCFQVEWFNSWEWLEYSVSKDAAFCFYCYLFRGDNVKRPGADVFVKTGFRNWKKASEKFRDHVGAAGSVHNDAKTSFLAFKDQRQILSRNVSSVNQATELAYRTRLTVSVDVIRLLLLQGLAFRGHDESASSHNRSNFLEVLDWYGSRHLDVGKVVNENVPGNHKATSPSPSPSPSIQLDIISACASETMKVIVEDIGDKFFSLLVDEARDSSVKEQMAIVIRYVNDHGLVMERFLGIVHVMNTSALSLKSGIDDFFAKYGLSLSKLRGQGYDGASNLRGDLNGLKALILKENPYAKYVHCFAHQLQLVVKAVAEVNQFVSDFFQYLSMTITTVGASCKRKDEFRQTQHEQMVESLETGDIFTERGMNQESTFVRPGDTRWGSHYAAIIRLLSLWSSTIQVLENIFHDGTDTKTRGLASSLVNKMESYQFVFIAHLMKQLLGLTNTLSQLLQQKDQNIIAAVSLIQSTKSELQSFRENGWDGLLEEVNNFCVKNHITVLNMEDNIVGRFRLGNATTNYHQFRVQIFCQVIDLIIQEMENRFSESSTELLKCIGCLDPRNLFSNFEESNILQLAEMYPQEFSGFDQMELKEQLKMWISEMRRNEKISTLQDIGDVARVMVEEKYHTIFHLVYRLIELVLVLPVATATVERAFSVMRIVKSDLRNKMGDEFLSDCLVCYIERDIFKNLNNEVILQHFQNMKTRKVDLPALRLQ